MDNILSVTQLTKKYSRKTTHCAVDSIDFFLREGEILGFLGPNGSGKTTTIQMLLGALTPTKGQIRYFGKDFKQNRSEILSKVSFSSTYANLPPLLTIRENLHIYGLLYGFTKKETMIRCKPLLEMLGIEEKLSTRVSSLSAGQMTRLMLVKALFMNPKILLLDEPTASLDPDIARDICEHLLQIRSEINMSILFTSHKMEEVSFLCDRVIFLKSGKIVADGIPKNLAKQAGVHRLQLISDNVKKIAELLDITKKQSIVEHNMITIQIEESEIPRLLSQLVHEKIHYSSIRILEPSLEEYFIQLARTQ